MESIDSLGLSKGDKVLIIGCGTGLDLPYFPKGVELVATDITPAMVNKTAARAKNLGIEVQIQVMDGAKLQFPDNHFDAVVLHLILAVMPEPIECIKEVERVLKSGGQVTVFDKFLPKRRKVRMARRIVNLVSNLLATRIDRSFENLVNHSSLIVESDKPKLLKGNFRLIKLRKVVA